MAILNTDIKNANIKFLNGLQSDLNTLIASGGAVKGAFYLTSDTHRLYIGQEDNNRTDLTAGAQRVVPVPVNEGITTVTNINQLPSVSTADAKAGVAGSFYYVTGTTQNPVNILCIYNGQEWVQINPDTNTTIDYFYHSISDIAASGQDPAKTRLTSNLRDNNGSEVAANVDFVGANGITISSVSEASFNAGTYNSSAAKVITITGDDYSLSNSVNSNTKTATITLASSDTNKTSSSVNIVGKDNIAIGTENGNITITGTDTYITNIGIANRANSGNGFVVSATLNNGNVVDSNYDPVIHFDVDGGADYHFVNGVANLPLYTKQEIDLVLRQLNSMVYKGVIGYGQLITQVPNSSSVQDSGGNVRYVSVGDTYKIGSSVSSGTDPGFSIPTGASATATVHKGDLIIAQGTEYTESNYPSGHPELIGTIDPSTLYWGYIPSGDDTFVETTYVGQAIQNGVKLVDSAGNDTAQFKVVGDGTYISIVDTVNPASYNSQTIPNYQQVSVQHNIVDTATYSDNTVAVSSTTTQVPKNTMTIPVITNIQRDAAGHVLKITTTNYQVTDTNANVRLYQTDTTSDANHTYSKVDTQLILQDANGSDINTSVNTTSFVMESSTMEVTSGTKTIGTSTYDTVKMELVWGSFA